MDFVLIILLVSCLVPLGYLYLLLVASLRKLPDVDKSTNLRFAVFVRLLNEEGVIAGTLKAIRSGLSVAGGYLPGRRPLRR
jgi:membrane carboxypeptidase/penicillin-binding protein